MILGYELLNFMPKQYLSNAPICNDNPYTQVGTITERVTVKIGCGNCGVFLTETMLIGTNFDRFDEIRNKLIAK